jgi:3-mercaptopyruvate sulfurtransferase SseA/sterol desaturase/sphingolipid hydroxylase (fatty acid hydroxylase superfamily)
MDYATYSYPISLGVLSAAVMLLERLFPWRPRQRQLRRRFWSDLLHLGFNGHFLGVIVAGLAASLVIPHVDALIGPSGASLLYRGAAASWPIWAQIPVALFALDFVQWCIHNLLHRVPLLWEIHKTHHSVVDGEMDWIVSFRFQWPEVVVYKAMQYVPLAFFGFASETILFHAIFGTLIGHLNHANLDWGHGPWRYLLNNPRMHIWHHDYRGDAKTTVNFGIIFSCWDWIFGTAKVPNEPSPRLGFPGVESFPDDFFGQEAWPIGRLIPRSVRRPISSLLGAALIALGWWFHPPRSTPATLPMLGEKTASSQPSTSRGDFAYARSVAEANLALAHFGEEARRMGFAHAEHLVAVDELARALTSDKLVILDVRPLDRFQAGRIASARRVFRGDYSDLERLEASKDLPELEKLLASNGVRADSVVVIYGDGGPEPYRLWWTLFALGSYPARILDGGLVAWKAAGHPVAEGSPKPVPPGDVRLSPPKAPVARHWDDVSKRLAEEAGADRGKLLDTRTRAEYVGETKHQDAARAGHIPGAIHMEWTEVLRSPTDTRLKPRNELEQAFAARGVGPTDRVVTSCQTGTRSAATYFALHELGFSGDQISNYEGSWGEYSRLPLPIAVGAP